MQYVMPLVSLRLGRWALIGFGLFAVTLFVLWAFFLRNERAYLVEADTQGMTIAFDRSAASSWRLTDVTVCRRLGQGEATDNRQRYCDARRFSEIALPSLEIDWPSGTRIEVERHRTDGALTIRIADTAERMPEAGGQKLAPGSLIFVASDGWAGTGALIFSGAATIGAIPGPGSRDLLLSGRYEIREALVGRSNPVTLREGTLSPGDSVTIVGADGATGAAVSGFLLRRQSGDPWSGFKVTAFSPSADIGLRISRLNAEPAVVTASWADRALRDPWLLGLAALLGFVSTVVGLVARLWPAGA